MAPAPLHDPTSAPAAAPKCSPWCHAREVLLRGNGLLPESESESESESGSGTATAAPARWAGRDAFTVLDTGFALGHGFIATWDAWRRDPQRPRRLHFVGLEASPPTADELRRNLLRDTAADPALAALATALCAAWPPLTRNLHPLDFDGGRVRLLLGFGGIEALLPQLHGAVDAFFLHRLGLECQDGPRQLPLLKRLGRLAAPGATLVVDHADASLHAGLRTAGFEVTRQPVADPWPAHTVARHAPQGTRRGPPLPQPYRGTRKAVVVGAGLAGAAVARALADSGWQVRVLDRHAQAAAEASGNAAGLFHGTVHSQDGPHARLLRAASLLAERRLRPAVAAGLPGAVRGLLRRAAPGTSLADMQALIDAQSLPADHVQALSAADASARAGVPLSDPAWFFPGGGWVDPGAWVRLMLDGLALQGGATVAAIEATGASDDIETSAAPPAFSPGPGSIIPPGWRLRDPAGCLLAEAPVIVLACPATVQSLLARWPGAAWRLGRSRGQVDGWRDGAGSSAGLDTGLGLPIAGDGYALPLPGGLLYGATVEPWVDGDGDDGDGDRSGRSPAARIAATAYNRERLLRLCDLRPPEGPQVRHFDRIATRLLTSDRLPLLGAVPGASGLFVATALGSRGITWAALLADLLVAMIEGSVWPLERDLAAALDPARPGLRAQSAR